MRRSHICLCLTAITACFPVMAHPTRVDAGFRIGGVLGLSMASDSGAESGEATNVVIPSIDFEASLGVRDTANANAPGFRFSGAAGFRGYGGAVYSEVPRSWFGNIDAGVGFAAHHGAIRFVMPHTQFGHSSGSSSWFVQNGVAWVTPRDSSKWAMLWIPTIGTGRRINRGREFSFYMTAIVGNQPRVERYCLFFECFSYSNSFVRTSLIIGMSYSVPLGTNR